MLYQLQHQKADSLNNTVLVAQGEPPPGVQLEEFLFEWKRDVETRHPTPVGWQWLVCDEYSEYFKWARVVAKELRDSEIDISDETERRMIDSESC